MKSVGDTSKPSSKVSTTAGEYVAGLTVPTAMKWKLPMNGLRSSLWAQLGEGKSKAAKFAVMGKTHRMIMNKVCHGPIRSHYGLRPAAKNLTVESVGHDSLAPSSLEAAGALLLLVRSDDRSVRTHVA